MNVAVGTDERADVHAVAADILHEIAEDRETRDDFQLLLCAGRTNGEQRGNGRTGDQASLGQHGNHPGCRPKRLRLASGQNDPSIHPDEKEPDGVLVAQRRSPGGTA